MILALYAMKNRRRLHAAYFQEINVDYVEIRLNVTLFFINNCVRVVCHHINAE